MPTLFYSGDTWSLWHQGTEEKQAPRKRSLCNNHIFLHRSPLPPATPAGTLGLLVLIPALAGPSALVQLLGKDVLM